VGIDRFDGVQVCAFATHQSGHPPFTGRRHYRLRLEVPELPLLKGEFSLYVFLLDEQGLHVFDRRVEPVAFRVESEGYRFGLFEVPHAWELAEPVELRVARRA
jgi:lipopolysaccharide transport system ATP-binding protein